MRSDPRPESATARDTFGSSHPRLTSKNLPITGTALGRRGLMLSRGYNAMRSADAPSRTIGRSINPFPCRIRVLAIGLFIDPPASQFVGMKRRL